MIFIKIKEKIISIPALYCRSSYGDNIEYDDRTYRMLMTGVFEIMEGLEMYVTPRNQTCVSMIISIGTQKIQTM